MSYLGILSQSYFFAEMQSVYSIAPVDWVIACVEDYVHGTIPGLEKYAKTKKKKKSKDRLIKVANNCKAASLTSGLIEKHKNAI